MFGDGRKITYLEIRLGICSRFRSVSWGHKLHQWDNNVQPFFVAMWAEANWLQWICEKSMLLPSLWPAIHLCLAKDPICLYRELSPCFLLCGYWRKHQRRGMLILWYCCLWKCCISFLLIFVVICRCCENMLATVGTSGKTPRVWQTSEGRAERVGTCPSPAFSATFESAGAPYIYARQSGWWMEGRARGSACLAGGEKRSSQFLWRTKCNSVCLWVKSRACRTVRGSAHADLPALGRWLTDNQNEMCTVEWLLQ